MWRSKIPQRSGWFAAGALELISQGSDDAPFRRGFAKSNFPPGCHIKWWCGDDNPRIARKAVIGAGKLVNVGREILCRWKMLADNPNFEWRHLSQDCHDLIVSQMLKDLFDDYDIALGQGIRYSIKPQELEIVPYE
jgi:hypothetical protein